MYHSKNQPAVVSQLCRNWENIIVERCYQNPGQESLSNHLAHMIYMTLAPADFTVFELIQASIKNLFFIAV